MSVWDIIKSVFELGLIVFTVWALFHEERFVDFEDRIVALFRRKRFKVIRGSGSPARAQSFKKIS